MRYAQRVAFFYYYCLKITIFIINIINSFISMKKLLTFFLTALLAFSVGWAGEVTDVLDVDFTGVTQVSYINFVDKTGTSGAVYAGQCANYYDEGIQLRSKNSNSGIVTTGSGGKVKSITVVWHSQTTPDRTLNVYGKNSAYTAATDLYGNNSGTLVGTIVYGTSTSLTINGDYEYIGFRSADGALYLASVSIVWETSESDGPAKPTFSIGGSTVTGNQAVDLGTVVTISAEAGNTLAYTVDGTDPSTSNTAVMTSGNTAEVMITEGCTIRAIAKDADANVSGESSINITVNAPVAGNWYKKVTSANDLGAGKKYIIVNEANNVGMSAITTINGTNVGGVVEGLEFDNEKVNISNTDVAELTLGKNGDNWTFVYGGTNYLSWSSGNSLTTSGNVNDASSWTVASKSVGGVTGFSLTNVGTPARTLYYNSGSPRFACYQNSQSLACLYVQDTNDPYLTISPESKSVELPVGDSSITAQFTVNGGNLTGDVTVTASGDGFTASPATLTAAQVQEGATVTVTYNGTAAANGTVTVTSGTTQAQATMTVTQAVPTAPVITLAADPCYDDQTVTITAQEGTTIYYTTDGSEPTTASAQYNGEFTIAYNSENTTVKAIAVNGTQQSTVATKSFAWGTVTISLSPANGSTFQGSTMTGTVTVSPSDAQVTLTGADYHADDHTFTVTAGTVGAMVTVEATATKGQSTATASATYTRVAADAPAAPTFSVAAGAVAAGTQLVISAPEGCTLFVNGQAVENPYTVTIDNAMTF